jgi:hypothetical protein
MKSSATWAEERRALGLDAVDRLHPSTVHVMKLVEPEVERKDLATDMRGT